MKKIELTQGFNALVDREDYIKLSQYKWRLLRAASDRKYAIASINGKQILMHRFILDSKKGEMIDHINGSGIDNRKDNLRMCTHSQNMSNRKLHKNNTTGYKGIHCIKSIRRTKPWRAEIYSCGKKYFIGCFATAVEAAQAYNEAAIKHHGEFAKLNKIS